MVTGERTKVMASQENTEETVPVPTEVQTEATANQVAPESGTKYAESGKNDHVAPESGTKDAESEENDRVAPESGTNDAESGENGTKEAKTNADATKDVEPIENSANETSKEENINDEIDSEDMKHLKALIEEKGFPNIDNLVFEGGGAKGIIYYGVIKVNI